MAQYNAQQYSQSSAWSSTAANVQTATNSSPAGSSMWCFNKGFTVGWGATGTITEPLLTYMSAKYEKRRLYQQTELLRLQQKEQSTAADDVMRGGERQAASIGYQAGQAKSSSRASMAAAGVQVGAAGNSAEALASIDVVKEMQVNQVMANAVTQSWGYRKAAVQTGNEALATERAAKDISPLLAAFVEFNNQMAQMMDEGGGGADGSADGGKSRKPKGLASGFKVSDVSDFASIFKSGSSLPQASPSAFSSVGAVAR